MNWTGPAELRGQVQKWWDRGELLAPIVTGDSTFPRRLVLKVPAASEIAAHFEDVRAWIADLRSMSHCRI